jgi:colanic acid biosynthesis glycosyl transferase WcaI
VTQQQSTVGSAGDVGDGRPLRILLVTQYFWPENFQINHLVRALRDRGHSVEVLTGKPNYPSGRFFDGYSAFGRAHELFEGIPVRRVPLAPRGDGGSLRLALNYLSFAASATFTGLANIRGDFDCIFVYAPSPITACLPALAIGRKTGAPVVLWVQDLWPESVTAASNAKSLRHAMPLLNGLVRSIYRGCARILIQSRAFRPSIESFAIPPERIAYLPQSVDDLFQQVPAAEEAPAALQEPGFKIVFAGNIGQAQGFETLVEAAERLRNTPVRWIILGDGRRREWLSGEIRRRKLERQIALPGAFPETAMPGFFAHADALLVMLRDEPIFALTIPTKVQAYLACGKPIIAALRGEGARVVEESEAGVTAEPGNPESLAAAVLRLMQMTPEERAKMGARGLAYSRTNFDRDMLADRLVALLRGARSG